MVIGPVVLGAMVYYGYAIPKTTKTATTNPGLWEYLTHLVGCVLVVDVLFFYAHWLLHVPALYGAWMGEGACGWGRGGWGTSCSCAAETTPCLSCSCFHTLIASSSCSLSSVLWTYGNAVAGAA